MNHCHSIKPSTAQRIALSCGVDISHNLAEFAERVFLMPDEKVVRVMYIKNKTNLEGVYLDVIDLNSVSGNGPGKSHIETEVPF